MCTYMAAANSKGKQVGAMHVAMVIRTIVIDIVKTINPILSAQCYSNGSIERPGFKH